MSLMPLLHVMGRMVEIAVLTTCKYSCHNQDGCVCREGCNYIHLQIVADVRHAFFGQVGHIEAF